jgi:hypothetical protein
VFVSIKLCGIFGSELIAMQRITVFVVSAMAPDTGVDPAVGVYPSFV